MLRRLEEKDAALMILEEGILIAIESGDRRCNEE